MSKPNFNKKAFVYITTNRVNGKKYIGVRTYKNTINDDKYYGSGKAIKAALAKYGPDNFTKSIIFEGTARECYKLERILVNQAIVDDPDYYNLSQGGWGGNRGEEATSKMKETLKKQYKDLPDEVKQERKFFLESIRPKGPSKIKGSASPKWIGYWITPNGTFLTCREAAAANSIDSRTLRNRCRNKNLHLVEKKRKGVIPADWVGKSYKQLGWYFASKEVKVE